MVGVAPEQVELTAAVQIHRSPWQFAFGYGKLVVEENELLLSSLSVLCDSAPGHQHSVDKQVSWVRGPCNPSDGAYRYRYCLTPRLAREPLRKSCILLCALRRGQALATAPIRTARTHLGPRPARPRSFRRGSR